MTTQELNKLNNLAQEVEHLKSLVSRLVPLDQEGDYKKPFVTRLEKTSQEEPVAEYTQKGDLLQLLK